MHSFAPLRRTYSAVSSPLASSDEIRYDDQELPFKSQPQSSKPSPRTIPRHSFLIRLIIFTILQFGFIALVSTALEKPIVLHLLLTITEIKGAVTAISILWHALATYAVKDILLNMFSAEWMRLYDGSPSLTLQELDIVSRLTTGFSDQAKHFMSKHATPSFRLAFLSLLLLLLLNGLGPSAIGVNLVPYTYLSNIQVANLTIGAGDQSDASASAVHRASLITQLERVENFTTSGYSAKQRNLLIPWPLLDAISANTTMTYQSDVIRYNFSCSWVAPSLYDSPIPFLTVAGDGWTVYPSTSRFSADEFRDPLIFPLRKAIMLSHGEVETSTKITANSSLLPFIFVGRNASSPTVLDLTEVPSLLLACNTTLNPDDLNCLPSLVSVLLCNPQLEILPATINATLSSLDATILPGVTTVNNIPAQAANVVSSSSLLGATSEAPVEPAMFNAISSQLFLPDHLSDLLASSTPIKPLSLQEINRNMNEALASSSKAYLGGYKLDEDDAQHLSYAGVNTSAMMEVQKMALVGSKPFLIASSILVGLLVVLLGVLVMTTQVDQLQCFELENIVKMMRFTDHSSSDA